MSSEVKDQGYSGAADAMVPHDHDWDDDKTNPQHYAHLNEARQSAVHIIEAWGLGFHLGNAVKYIQRAGHKPGESEIDDLKKASWYLCRHIHLLDPSEPDPMEKG